MINLERIETDDINQMIRITDSRQTLSALLSITLHCILDFVGVITQPIDNIISDYFKQYQVQLLVFQKSTYASACSTTCVSLLNFFNS